jgi:DNA primase
MAGRIRREDVLAVRERADMVKVVSGQLQLKPAGRDRMVGLCPFHPEKTPSFSIKPSEQVYYCFGCGEGGDIFKFLEKTQDLTFGEAVEMLAKETGVTLRYEGETQADRRAHSRRQALFRVNADAARLYNRTLTGARAGADARAYLASRGISMDSVERFLVGYAPGYPDFVLKQLSRSYSADLLVEAGLVSKDGDGNLRDRFRGRIMFPIHDLSGNAVGFGGRLLEGPHAPQNAAKYVNSPDTPVYHKGTLLYNLHRAKADITRSGRAWLVEGYTDIIALDQAGLREAVATCGTALGEDHFRHLSRFADKVLLAFDSDEAGARAAERAYQFHERYHVEVSVLVLPQGQDPADFAQARGGAAGEAFLALEDQAVPLVVYMIERALVGRDLGDVEEQARAVQAGVRILSGLHDSVRQERYSRVLADRVGVNVGSVMLELERSVATGDATESSTARAARPVRESPAHKVEREVLKLMVQASALCIDRIGSIEPGQFSKPEYRKAFELIRGDPPFEAGDGDSLVARAQANSDHLGALVAALAMEPPETLGDVTAEYVERMFLRFEEFALKRRSEDLRKRLERMNPVKASADFDALYEQFVQLEGARRRVQLAQEGIGSTQ